MKNLQFFSVSAVAFVFSLFLPSIQPAANNTMSEILDNAIQEEDNPSIKEVLDWEIPYYIRKNFPFFISGFDDEGCPVWVAEYGRWDVRAVMENGTQSIQDFGRYIKQALTIIHMSPKYFSTPEKPVEEFVVIGDLDGFNVRQFSHVPTLTRALDIFRDYIALDIKYGRTMKAAYGVNVNYLANSIWNLAKPLIGDLASRVHIHGTNDKWKVHLLRDIPREALPSFLGGFDNHTPVKVYG